MNSSLQSAEHAAPATVLVGKNGAAPTNQPPLSALDGRTVALHLSLPGQDKLLIGRCTYARDPQLGPVLRIELPAGAACEFLLIERTFNGQILAGQAHGCDYLIRLGTPNAGEMH